VKVPTSAGFPDVLLIIIVLRNNGDTVCNEVCRIETDTKLTNHGMSAPAVRASMNCLVPDRADRTEVVDEILRMLVLV